MNNDNDIRLTFSQRVGKAPLPEPMRLEYLPKRFRNLVWFCFDEAIKASHVGVGSYIDDSYMRTPVNQVIQIYIRNIMIEPHDNIEHTIINHQNLLRNLILDGDYHDVLTLIENVLETTVNKHHPAIRTLVMGLRQCFKATNIAYNVEMLQRLPTVVPRSSPETGAATIRAMETVEEKGPEGAKTHLREAARHINAQDYADGIRESIHAVESVVRTIDPRANAKLGSALTSLEKAGVLKHGLFKKALEKLYGYTNSEEGIRHPLLDEGAADVDLDDAVFMFSACAAFSAYLLNRHRQIT